MLLFYAVVWGKKNQTISSFASIKCKIFETITTWFIIPNQELLVCKWTSYFFVQVWDIPLTSPQQQCCQTSLHQFRPVLTCSKECASSGQKIYDPQLWRWTNNGCLYLSVLSYSSFKLVMMSSWFSKNLFISSSSHAVFKVKHSGRQQFQWEVQCCRWQKPFSKSVICI